MGMDQTVGQALYYNHNKVFMLQMRVCVYTICEVSTSSPLRV